MRRLFPFLLLAAFGGYAAFSQQDQAAPEIVPQTGGGFGGQSVLFGSDGRWLVTAANDGGDIRIYDLVGGRMAREIHDSASYIAVHPSKRVFAAFTVSRGKLMQPAGGQLKLYDAITGNVLWSVSSSSCAAPAI